MKNYVFNNTTKYEQLVTFEHLHVQKWGGAQTNLFPPLLKEGGGGHVPPVPFYASEAATSAEYFRIPDANEAF